jgi:YjbE family integral membrane protein
VESLFSWFVTLDLRAIVQIVMIDVLLGGDNAVVIALACRELPPKQRRLGVFWGSVGAIALRVGLIFFTVQLLAIPLLKLVGGVLLLWIGVKLAAPSTDSAHQNVTASDKLWAAIKTIILADLLMSVDNVVAIAGAAQQADPNHRLGLVVFGLLVSVPFIVYGSQLVLKFLDRFPFIVLLGAALLGWIAGSLIMADSLVAQYVPQTTVNLYAAHILGALGVIVMARILEVRRRRRSTQSVDSR